MSTSNLPVIVRSKRAWNHGRIIGQKRPLLPKHVWANAADFRFPPIVAVHRSPITSASGNLFAQRLNFLQFPRACLHMEPEWNQRLRPGVFGTSRDLLRTRKTTQKQRLTVSVNWSGR
jgi:hypothetical protein